MKILRVETFSKVGLYSSNANRPEPRFKDHPPPHADELLWAVWSELSSTESWHFGFKDMAQLLKWWPRSDWTHFVEHNKKCMDERRVLGISTYDVDIIDLHLGRTQVIFQIDKAERLNFNPFTYGNARQKISTP
jgi:hypothetical protein